ncbi:IS30 family transposase [Leisingera sp. XS_AS12]|uniref:IS30 family transposase n=1 Tax=Leisingera sp. XS_AS12 TaxID=3241294 RepID=UPI003510E0FF
MAHTELDLHERCAIEDMLNAKMPVSKIAGAFGRHRSTVYREIKRNRFEDRGLPYLSDYYGVTAHQSAAARDGPGFSTIFPPERSIQQPPEHVKSRETFGEWEGDLMIFERAQGNANVATLVERKTRFAVLFRNQDRSTTHLMNRLMDVMEPLPQPTRRSITFDRGIQFRNWRKLKPGIGTEAWFCDPQAPWQKGSVENLNKRARRYLPRDTPVAALSNRSMKAICDRLNGTPRKCLG